MTPTGLVSLGKLSGSMVDIRECHTMLERSMSTGVIYPRADASIVSLPNPATKQPLRTYSKRSVSDRDAQSAKKRKRIEEPPRRSQSTPISTTRPKVSQPIPVPPRSPSKRGTIKYFFQSMKSGSTPPNLFSDTCSDATPAKISPPTSSPFKSAGTVERDQQEDDTPSDVAGVKWEQHLSPGQEDQERSSGDTDASSNEPQEKYIKGEPDHKSSELKDGNENTLNRGSRRPRKKTKAPKKKVTVQTTLSLTPDPGFMECKDCNIVYNPLHDKDAKYHARTHAAVLRKRNMG